MALTHPVSPETPIADERLQLVHRIVESSAFQKSSRLRDLLIYLTEQTIQGHAHDLSEHNIGREFFHKPSGYSPLEDSGVRVHVRQLRLKLHEYFDEEGRDEPVILIIPKGSYAPVFRPAPKPSTKVMGPAVQSPPAAEPEGQRRAVLPWIISAVLMVLLAVAGYFALPPANTPVTANEKPPWPFSQIFDARHQTTIVVADSNYGMYRIIKEQPGSLDQYLRRDFLQDPAIAKAGIPNARLNEYITNSSLTSFADVADVVSMLKIAGPLAKNVVVRFPRDLGMRDLDHDNFIFIGSPGSNPWVALFDSKLNFRESEAVVGNSAKAFVNTQPLAGEQKKYEGLRWTGTVGEDYATIALLPNTTHDGCVLALQGLQQEGTEAAERFLADNENRRILKSALGLSAKADPTEDVWFEALVKSRTVAGAPNSTSLIAVRRIR